MSGLGDLTKDIGRRKNREKIESLKTAQGYKPQGLDGSIEDMTLHQLVNIGTEIENAGLDMSSILEDPKDIEIYENVIKKINDIESDDIVTNTIILFAFQVPVQIIPLTPDPELNIAFYRPFGFNLASLIKSVGETSLGIRENDFPDLKYFRPTSNGRLLYEPNVIDNAYVYTFRFSTDNTRNTKISDMEKEFNTMIDNVHEKVYFGESPLPTYNKKVQFEILLNENGELGERVPMFFYRLFDIYKKVYINFQRKYRTSEIANAFSGKNTFGSTIFKKSSNIASRIAEYAIGDGNKNNLRVKYNKQMFGGMFGGKKAGRRAGTRRGGRKGGRRAGTRRGGRRAGTRRGGRRGGMLGMPSMGIFRKQELPKKIAENERQKALEDEDQKALMDFVANDKTKGLKRHHFMNPQDYDDMKMMDEKIDSSLDGYDYRRASRKSDGFVPSVPIRAGRRGGRRAGSRRGGRRGGRKAGTRRGGRR
jgi:hypothetical protein